MPHALDPATCRPRYPAQSRIVPTLYRSIESHGQLTPALVRPIPPTPGSPHLYEIICGHRRHATIRHLNHNGIETPFLADIQDLTDAEAFRLADIDNRERADISDYQRAQTYTHALANLYAGDQTAMARSLNLNTPQLARYLLLAALPETIQNAYADRDAIRLTDAIALAPLLRVMQTADRLLLAAKSATAVQATRRAEGKPPLTAKAILRRFKEAAAKPAATIPRHTVKTPAGRIIARGRRTNAGTITVHIPRNPALALHELVTVTTELLTRLRP